MESFWCQAGECFHLAGYGSTHYDCRISPIAKAVNGGDLCAVLVARDREDLRNVLTGKQSFFHGVV